MKVNWAKNSNEALIVFGFEGGELTGETKLDIAKLVSSGEFTGKPGNLVVLRGQQRVFLVGLGKKEKVDRDKIRVAAGRGLLAAREANVKKVAVELPKGAGAADYQALAEVAILSAYRFSRYKTQGLEELRSLEEVILISKKPVDDEIKTGVAIAESVNLAKDFANTPAKDATPAKLAETAKNLAKQICLHCTVLDEKEIKKLGMEGVLGVAAGSSQPPRFLILEHKPKKFSKTVVVVGKGITFDSGGLSLKPAKYMETMKDDKSGAAAVIGILRAAALLALPVHVVGLAPLTENMPGGSAIKPGDVLKMLNGKTVEVLNTDAEGRLILADALAYASRYKPDAIIDLATLTGAVVVALGTAAAGLLGNDDKLAAQLTAAGEETHERLWRLPLWEEYGELIKSDVADIKNVVSNDASIAGTITAAAFLSNFAPEHWAHVDIAGTAWSDKEGGYVQKGATGAGVRLVVEYLRKLK